MSVIRVVDLSVLEANERKRDKKEAKKGCERFGVRRTVEGRRRKNKGKEQRTRKGGEEKRR